MVVHAHVIGRGVIGLAGEVAQAQHAEAAREVDLALAAPEARGGHAGVDGEAVLELEAGLQATAQILAAQQPDARGVVDQLVRLRAVGVLRLARDVDAAVDGDAALRQHVASG
jgi:hypothetical protein